MLDEQTEQIINISNAAYSVIRNIESEIAKNIPLKNENYFHYISFPNEIFIRIMYYISTLCDTNKKFLDVGCGIGIKVLFANLFFKTAMGIECDKDIFNLSKNIGMKNIICIDALEFNDYDKFDIIYSYSPINQKELQQKLETKIATTMHSKAIILITNPIIDFCSLGFNEISIPDYYDALVCIGKHKNILAYVKI